MPTVLLDDRSHIAIDGEEAEHFLHNLVTTDIAGLPAGEVRAGALLSAQGKILFSFLIFRTMQGFVLDVARRDGEDFVKRLKFFRLRAKVNIGMPEAVSLSVRWNEQKREGFLQDARFGGLDVWRSTQSSAGDADMALWTGLRIAYGVAEPHLDYAYGEVFPHDVNLDQTGGLSFHKGCYVGQEVVSRMHHRGLARWRLMVAQGDGLEHGAPVVALGKPAGTIGSAAGDQALALVRLDRIKDALDRQQTVLAGGMPIAFDFPIGVGYDWPQASEATL